MGIAIPQVITSDRASGAQVIGGSLKFDSAAENRIDRTAASGSGTTWTLALWVKKQGNDCHIFGAGDVSTDRFGFGFNGSDKIFAFVIDSNSTVFSITTNAVFRDNGWYHIVLVADTTNGTQADRFKIYVNGVLQTVTGTLMPDSQDTNVNSAVTHTFGRRSYTNSDHFNGQITNAYLIDGQALEESDFGFTDPLTNTWKPKKYKGTFGTNGFWLPMDGNSPIGEDKSGVPSLNNGTFWSSSLTSSSGFRSSEPKFNAFDGDTSSICSAVGSGTITFTSPVTFASDSTIKVVVHGGDHTVTVNGGDDQTISAGSLQTVTYSNSGNATFTMTFHRGGGADTGVRAIQINGVILTDGLKGNSFTPVNFGGSVALDSRAVSGARPILNTTQGGTQAGLDVFGSRENIGYAVTVGDASGSNKFYLDGVEAPTLSNLIRGVTYTFDQSDSSNGTHPLVFGSTAEGNNFSRGALYGSISAGSAGAATTITIPYDAPETLYYHCSAHSGMGGSIVGIHTDETKADQYASNCTLALPLVGSDDDVCASIACTANNKTPTNSSVTASTAESNFYKGSHYWSANTDQLQYAEQGDELVFGTGDFTIECWVYDDDGHSGTGGRCYIFDSRIGGSVVGDPPQVAAWVDGNTEFNFNYSAGTISVTVPSTIGKWWHFAATREGTTIKFFLDGILRGSATDSTDFPNNGIGVGRATDGGYGWAGYIQDFRVYRGVAKYTSDFVVPATNPDTLPDTPSGVSGGSKLTKITDGAVSFDGSGDYLMVPDDDDFDLGTGDFTFEAFIHQTLSYTNYRYIFSHYDGSNGHWLRIDGDGPGAVQFGAGSTAYITSTTKVALNRWHHVAVVRVGTTVTLYLDGNPEGTYTLSGDITSTGEFRIGRQGSSTTHYFGGFISNLRINKGTALYTSRFTPPTAPLTNVTNTKLLCCQSNVTSAAAAASPNISGINDGTIWSSIVGGPTRIEDRVANAFKGSSGSPGAIPAYPGRLEFRPGITGISTLAVRGYYAGSGVSLTVNDVAQSPSGGAYDIGITTTRLDSIVWTAIDGFNYYRIDQIEIDGVALVDPVVGVDDSEEAATNFNPFNTDINTVRGQETDYPTMNPLSKNSSITLTEGNLHIASTGNHGDKKIVHSTAQIPNDGKWYVEWHIGGPGCTLGFGRQYDVDYRGSDVQIGVGSSSWGYEPNGNLFHDGNQGGSYGASSAGDVIGMTIDTSGSTVTAQWYENGVLIRNSSGAAAEFTGIDRDDYTVMMSQHSPNYDTVVNFGQKPFKFAPPDGFQPLSAAGVRPETVIVRPDQYVGVTTYNGNAGTQSINCGFKPDFVWIKNRDDTSGGAHRLFDSVRGASKTLYSNFDLVEAEVANSLNSFDFNGFTVGSGNWVNGDEDGIVAWTWKAGGDKNTFNIDYVGYSTAGDANMGIADLNSSLYNTSQVWSDGIANPGSDFDQAATNAFNGNRSNVLRTGSNSVLVTLNFSPALTVNSTIEILAEDWPTSNHRYTVTVDGTTSTKDATGVPATFNVSGSLTQITLDNNNGSGRTYLTYIKVDGKELIDSDITPPNIPSIAPSGCSVGTKQGFSIIKYTGTGTAGTIPHGLLEKPTFVMIKDLKNENSWAVQHSGTVLGEGLMKLNNNNKVDTSVASAVWNSTAPTSSVFSVGTAGDVNYTTNSAEYIAYLWHDVPGLQKFGTYYGNSDSDGKYVHLGFRPAILIIKEIDSTGYWYITDSARNPTNDTSTSYVWANESTAEQNDYSVDLLSDGFDLYATSGNLNSTNKYLYAAWAEAPSVNLFGGVANAR